MGLGKTYSTQYLLDSNNNSGVAGQVLSTTSTGIDWADANTLPGSGLWLANGNDIYNSNSGNVGIGTTTPTTTTGIKLDVIGGIGAWAANNTSTLKLFNGRLVGAGRQITNLVSTNGNGSLELYRSDNLLNVLITGSGDSYFNGGNVGIGVTGPSAKLHVDSSTAFSLTSVAGDTLFLSDDTNPSALNGVGASIGFSGPQEVQRQAAIAALRTGADHDHIGLAFYTHPGTSNDETIVEQMRITDSGNVGIGTTSPGNPLEISSDTSTSLVYQRTGVSANKWGFHSDNDATYWQNVTSSSLLFTLQNGGNVGIGTTSPSEKLEIQGGNVKIEQTANADSKLILNPNSSGLGTTYQWELVGGSSTSNYNFQIREAGQAYVTVDSSVNGNAGNVGIGTTSPTRKLVVSNGGASGIEIEPNYVAGVNEILSFDRTVGATAYETMRFNGGDFEFQIGGTEQMRISSAGAIKFNAYNSTNNTGTPTYVLGTDASGNVVKVLGGDIPGGGGTVTGTGSATQVAFWDTTSSLSGSNNLYWDSTEGHLGINDSTPGSPLKVFSGTTEDSIYSVDINHVRDDANAESTAMRINMNLSGADTTTTDITNRGIYLDLDSSANGDASNEQRIRGIDSDVRFSGFTDNAVSVYGFAESNYNVAKTAQLIGVQGYAAHDSSTTSGGVSFMYGVYGLSSIQDLGDVDNAWGGAFLTSIPASRGNANVGVTKGVEGKIQIDKAETITYGEMSAVSGIIDNNETTFPTFGNQYLFKGIYSGTRGGNAYGVYSQGDKHYFEGDVGIGTTGPTFKLHVNSTDASDNVAYIHHNNAAQSSGDVLKVRSDAGDNAGSALLNVANNTGSALYVRGDRNVGIGTTSPGTKLQVGTGSGATVDTAYQIVADGSAISGIQILSGATQSGRLVFGDSGNNDIGIIKYDHSDNSLQTIVNAAERMRITSSGDVGIGTTSPGAKLHLVSGTGVPYSLRLNSDATGTWQLGVGSTGYYDGSFLLQDASVGDRLRINPSGTFTLPAYNSTNQTGTPTYLLGTDASGNVVKTNTVPGSGAGPYLPLAGGTMTGDFLVSGAITIEPGGDTLVEGVLEAQSGIEATGGDKGQPGYTFIGDTNTGMYSDTADQLDFATGGNIGMVIDSSSNVGIGTTSPGAKLDVRSTSRTAPVVLKLGNGIISGDNGVIVSQIRSYINNSNTDADELARIQVENGSGSHDDGNLSFWTRDGFNNVDAAKQLQISGKGIIDIKNDGTALLPVLIFGADVDTGFFRPSSNNIALSTSGVERIRVLSGGNVGIGTTSPAYKLDVQVSGNVARFGDGTRFFRVYTDSDEVSLLADGSVPMKFYTGGAEKMRITSTGNVGIGNTSPGNKLEVTGIIEATVGDTGGFAYGANPATKQGLMISVSNTGGDSFSGAGRIENTSTANSSSAVLVLRQTNSASFSTITQYRQGSGTQGNLVGFVRVTTTNTIFSTSGSDERLKKNITNWTDDTLGKFKALQPKKFRYKIQDASEEKTSGFIAQNEVANFPEAYILNKENEEDDAMYSFNPMGMTTHLMKAIKDLVEKVEILENKITQLENNN